MAAMSKVKEISDYICSGSHAIVGCDDLTLRSRLANSIEKKAAGLGPFARISGSTESTESDFEMMIRESCSELLDAIGESLPEDMLRIDECLNQTMSIFRSSASQGFLLIDQIDGVISNQHPYVIEGALRAVMQRFDDVAVVLCGSNDVVINICQPDRPFYHSIRVFRV